MDNYHECSVCSKELYEPYIRCVKCPAFLCVQCFALGQEVDKHENNHSYTFIRNNFNIFETSWTSAQEMELLNAILRCGFGNWDHISTFVPGKTAQECEDHYTRFYINSPLLFMPKMPKISKVKQLPLPATKPDPQLSQLTSEALLEMAGYMPARDQFEIEPDNYAEMDLCHLDFDVENIDPLEKELQFAALDVYRNRMRERERKKRIVKRYGLLNPMHSFQMWRKYDQHLGRQFSDAMRPFMKLTSPEEFTQIMDNYNRQKELEMKIKKLKEFCENGLTSFCTTELYLQEKKRRTEFRAHRQQTNYMKGFLKYLNDKEAFLYWLSKHLSKETAKGLAAIPKYLGRKPAPPLEIESFADHDKLSEKEKKLCSELRLMPSFYLKQKQNLILECDKAGGLRLLDARNLVKIDVNKTRRIYDLLIEEGLINT